MDPEVFNLVYNSFWDLYTFKPKIRDVSARKLQAWIQKIRLISGPDRSQPSEEGAKSEGGEGEEAKEEAEEEEPRAKKEVIETTGEDTYDPICAVVRLKIPKVPLEPEMDDEGNPIVVDINESDLEDIQFDDKCLTMNTKLDDQHIWVINHMA